MSHRLGLWERDELAHLKKECNSPKHELIRLLARIEQLSPAQARGLESVIARLEAWQNRGAR